MSTATLEQEVEKTRKYLEEDFQTYEESTDPQEKYFALHRLNSALFICGDLLANNSNGAYEDLRLRFKNILSDPAHQSDPAIQKVKKEHPY